MSRASCLGRVGWAVACVLLGACAKSEPPRALSLQAPELVVSRDPFHVTVQATRGDGTRESMTGALPFVVTPAELASVDQNGAVTCRRSGDGEISLTLSGVKGSSKLACKLVARIDAPERLVIDAATGELTPKIAVLDAAGKQLDVPLSLSSDRGSVVQARGGALVPGSVGRAKLTLRAGQVARSLEVEVVRTLHPEAVPVDQNRRIHYSLDAGKYELSLRLPVARRVSIEWLGAPYCNYRGEGTEHTSTCSLQSRGAVSFDNPGFLGDVGKSASVKGVTLREVP